MARILLALLIAGVVLPALAADESEGYPPPKEMVLLTVGGLIGNTNRGALDPKKDSLLATQKASFKNGFAFDRPALLALEQGEVTAQPPEFDKPATFKGPLLREILGHVEAAKVKISFTAVDGYTGWLSPEDIDASDWIIALEANGQPLGIGQQGPLFLINTRAPDFKADDDHHAHWIWGLFYIHVGDE
ncbi:hypothetical protein [Methyloceanibacter sp.]|uniref:hypothetical protein n=1 Tax=Methyloceanibacter sp. TaxID=1965321 RepID=UPI002D364099|nr:hypothetical protein [Methyloceanibacter sp.]HZP08174.1 hypothetical protein [Methyloceanibacter sp.]